MALPEDGVLSFSGDEIAHWGDKGRGVHSSKEGAEGDGMSTWRGGGGGRGAGGEGSGIKRTDGREIVGPVRSEFHISGGGGQALFHRV